jgi:activin receptor type-2B
LPTEELNSLYFTWLIVTEYELECAIFYFPRWTPQPTTPKPKPKTTPKPNDPASQTLMLGVYAVISLLVVCLVLGSVFAAVVYKRRKANALNANGEMAAPGEENGEAGGGALITPKLTKNDAELLACVARGRFGAVWRGKIPPASNGGEETEDVAVKIFPLSEKRSWFAEQEIYNLPRMKHVNILDFIGVDERYKNPSTEYWLMTMFHEKGESLILHRRT